MQAAWAGDAGRGFAVVAEEVKRLADQTSQDTVDISKRIDELRTEMGGILTSMGQVSVIVEQGRQAISATGESMKSVSQRIDQVTQRMQEVSGIIVEQKSAVAEMTQGVTVVADMTQNSREQVENILEIMDTSSKLVVEQLDALAGLSLPKLVIHLAKSDHVIWKKRLASMLVGRAELHSSELADHHQCRLGKWYDNVTDPLLTGRAEFRELVGPHKIVHEAGKLAVDLYNGGDLSGALRELRRVNEASQDVLRILTALGT